MRKGPEVLAVTETDEKGRFRLERDEDLAGRGRTWSPTLWAYRTGSHIAFQEFKKALPGPDEPVQLTLGPKAAAALRVMQSNGKPAFGARARVDTVKLKAPRPPDQLLNLLAGTTDADGRVTIDGIAAEEISALDVTAQGQIVQELPVDDGETVSLRSIGRLKFRVASDDPKVLPGWTIRVWSHPTEPGHKGSYTTHWARETTGDDGTILFPTLAAGQVLWEIKPPNSSNYLIVTPPPSESGRTRRRPWSCPSAWGCRRRGSSVENPTGSRSRGSASWSSPIARSAGRSETSSPTATAASPRSFRPARSGLFPIPPADRVLPPAGGPEPDCVRGQRERKIHTVDIPSLRAAALLRGKRVDEAGEPLQGVTVRGVWSAAEFGVYQDV